MPSMFSGIEQVYRKKFIALYEEFLLDPSDESIKNKAEGMGMMSGHQFSEDINLAAEGAYKIELGKMTREEAKKILQNLKKNK